MSTPSQHKSKFHQSGVGASGSGSAADAFTPEMRDRQARGKNPYSTTEGSSETDEDEDDGVIRLGRGGPKVEAFADREKRGRAMAVLDSPEELSRQAQIQGNSVPAQRLRFTAELCGFNQPVQEHKTQTPRRNR